MYQARPAGAIPFLPLFVYGTLMRGERAHSLLAPQVTHASDAILDGASLYDLGRYPLAARGSGSVAGEILWLSLEGYEDTLTRLDRYEGSEYTRVQVDVRLSDAHSSVTAWTYLGRQAPAARAALIPHGDWRKWQQTERT